MGSVGSDRHLVRTGDIEKLRELLSGTDAYVRAPSDTDYGKSIDRWSKGAEKPAGVAVVPTSAKGGCNRRQVCFRTQPGLGSQRGRDIRPLESVAPMVVF